MLTVRDLKRHPQAQRSRAFRICMQATGALLAVIAGIAVYVWYPASGADSDRPSQREQADAAGTSPGGEMARPAGSPLESSLPRIDSEAVDPAIVSAIEEATAAVRRSWHSADAWGRLGSTLLAHEFDVQAAKCYVLAAKYDPSDARWPYLQAQTVVQEHPQDAVPLYEKAATLCDDVPDAPRLRLIELLIELDRRDEARTHLTEFLSHHATHARAHLAMARLHLREDKYEDSLSSLDFAKSHKATQRSAGLLMAEVYRRLGRAEDAESQRQRASKLSQSSWPDPYSAEVRKLERGLKTQLVRADRMFSQGDDRGSIKLLRETTIRYPESDWALIRLARAYIRQRRLIEAKDALERALLLAPHSVEAQFRMGVLLFLQDRSEEAAAWYEKAIRLKPDFTMAHYNLGFCRQKMNDLDGAIKALQNAVQCQPDSFSAQALLGDMLVRADRADEARKHLKQALRLQPGSTWAEKKIRELGPTESRSPSKP